MIEKVKDIVPFSDIKDKANVRTFYEKELQKNNDKEFKVEKEIRGKGGKLYVK